MIPRPLPRVLLLAALAFLAPAAVGTAAAQGAANARRPAWVLVIHGGAGAIRREDMSPEMEAEYRARLSASLTAGSDVLKGGGKALDAVEAAINVLEDSPLFNAGKGAVFTHNGQNELDASIMDGSTKNAGAVAGVHHVKNPISLARLVMEKSPHVLLAREGAEEFALEQGMALEPASYFFTESRWRSLMRVREREAAQSQGAEPEKGDRTSSAALPPALGTVGAVALDQGGHLAAGTSTGGMTDKSWGRIGDSPIIGAGTFADDASCAVSGTGHGEFYMRNVVAYDICARVRYLHEPLEDAARKVVMEELVQQHADGGVIALDPAGNTAWPFNTAGMFRGKVAADSGPEIKIYAEGSDGDR